MKISYEINNEQDLSNKLMGDYKNFSIFNKDKIKELNAYGEKIHSATKSKIMEFIK